MAEPYSPEQYQLNTWLGAVAIEKGEVPADPDAGPPPEPHPNEVATRKAVEAGIYDADDVGAGAEGK
jgi:hypothetical protein